MNSRSPPPRLLPRTRIERFGGRGLLYGWLRTHHDGIQSLRGVHRDIWAVLAGEAVADSAVAEDGGPRLRKRLARVWQRVRRDVAAQVTEAGRPAWAGMTQAVPPGGATAEARAAAVPPSAHRGGSERPWCPEVVEVPRGPSPLPVQSPPPSTALVAVGSGVRALTPSARLTRPGDLGLGFGLDDLPLIPLDAPYEFPTVDADGSPLPDGWVNHNGRIRPRFAAVNSERMNRILRIKSKPP